MYKPEGKEDYNKDRKRKRKGEKKMKTRKLNLNDLYVADYNSLYGEPEDQYSPFYAKTRIEESLPKWHIDETQFFVRAPQYA